MRLAWLPVIACAACCCALYCAGVNAQELPEAEISDLVAPGTVEPTDAAAAAPEPALTEYIEIHSKGYSRFEIGEGGHILVVYSGGVQFSYRGYALSASDMRFDQATRQAQVSGDVKITSEQFALTTQNVELDGMAGSGRVTGHLVGSLPKYGVSFEANEATLSFPAGDDLPEAGASQLVLSGGVTLRDRNGMTLLTDEVAYEGSMQRLSTAPFVLRGSLSGKSGTADAFQLSGVAANGQLAEGGGIAELNILGLLLVSKTARLSAARAVAKPAASGWNLELGGTPVRMEVRAKMKLPGAKAAQEMPMLLEAAQGSASIDGEGLSAASLSGGVVVSSVGNRLETASVTVNRRALEFAVTASGLRLGLNLQRLSGMKPVDLADIIE